MGLISLKPEQKVRLRQLLETTPQPWTAPSRANPGGRGRIPVLVRCTSATAAGGAEPGGTQCYPAVVVNINSLVATQVDGALVWLTILTSGTSVGVPVDERVYLGEFAGNFDPFPSGATDPRPRVFAAVGSGSLQTVEVVTDVQCVDGELVVTYMDLTGPDLVLS